jgi:uncharacterized protein with ParB-like and HNH nuclease domain
MSEIETNGLISEKSDEVRAAAEAQIVDESSQIKFFIAEYTIRHLAAAMKANEFVVPEYQRKFTWEDERRSKFIESVLMGLPIPFLLLWTRPDGRLEIVDGMQRLSTLHEFVYESFKLTELAELPLISGFCFGDLLEARQRKFLNRTIRGIILEEDTEEASRQELFERINTSSKYANPAEVRRGSLIGAFTTLIAQLSEDPIFVELTPATDTQKNTRKREELVARFFAYGDGLDGYRDRPQRFVDEYVKRMNEQANTDPKLPEEYKARFKRTMDAAKIAYGRFSKSESATTTPNARFEALAVGLDRALRERPELALAKVSFPESEEFRLMVGADGANVKKKLAARIDYVSKALLGGGNGAA